MTTEQATFFPLDAAVPEQRAQWLSLWHTWPSRDVMGHPGYCELFARPGDRVVCVYQIGVESGILFPLIVRPLGSEPWGGNAGEVCDLVSPYGYGGPFGWGSYHVEEFWSRFDQWAHTIRAVSLFTRFSLFKDQLVPFFGDTVVKGPCVIVPLQQDSSAMLASYTKTVRRSISQAERAGVTIEPDPECRRLEEFLSIYYATMDRVGARPMYYFPKSFFARLIGGLPNQVVLFHALHNQRVVSSQIILVSEHYLYSFLDGTLDAGLRLRANPCLTHGINLWGIAQGTKQVVLGGGYSGEDSLLQYKQRFAPNSSAPFAVGTRIMDECAYRTLIRTRATWELEQGNQWAPEPGFFPAYRG